MQIAETTHEHGINAKVYAYSGDYQLNDYGVDWQALVKQGDGPAQRLSGSIPISSAATALIAEQVVRDAIVRAIDTIEPIDANH